MRIHVQGRGVEMTEELHNFVQRRAQFALGRFQGRIHNVHVRLREPADQPSTAHLSLHYGCDVRIDCGSRAPIVIREQQRTLHAAASAALDRAERAIARQLHMSRIPARANSRMGFQFGD
jgi:ribosomal subunit interface protein